MANLTMLDLVALQRNDILTGLVEDVTTYAPEFSRIPVVTRPGTWYEIVRRVTLGTAAFRVINTGATTIKSTYKKEVKQMFFVDVPINVDEAILKADDKSSGDVWTHEAQGALQAALILLGAQVWYGTSNDANGFAGVRSQLAGVVGAQDAPTASATTSAYLLWMNGVDGCHFDVGENGAVALNPPMRQQVTVASPGSGTAFFWVSNLSCWVGFNVISSLGSSGGGSTWAVSGIATTPIAAGKMAAPLSDAVAAQLVANIPLVRRQGLCWFMNRTSFFTLQATRSAINWGTTGTLSLNPIGTLFPSTSTGAGAWAPVPNALEGYPIVVTDSITNTETN